MKKSGFMKDAFTLFMITLISGVLLGAVYQITAEPIAIAMEKAKQEAYKKVFTDVFVNELGVNNVDENKTIANLKGQPILQMTPFFTEDEEKVIMPEIPHCVSARWHPAFTDITVKGANKGNALITVARQLELDINECIAFGDGGNDLSILKAAGIGVAMGNANDDVKAVANYVTTSVDEDGIWNALKHFNAIRNE